MPNKNTTQVVCVAEFFAKEGKTDELIDALHVLMKPTHAEPAASVTNSTSAPTSPTASRSSKNGRTRKPSMSTAPCRTSRTFSTTCGPAWSIASRSSCTRRSCPDAMKLDQIKTPALIVDLDAMECQPPRHGELLCRPASASCVRISRITRRRCSPGNRFAPARSA